MEHPFERFSGGAVQRALSLAVGLHPGALRVSRQTFAANRRDVAAGDPALCRRGCAAVDLGQKRHGQSVADGLVRGFDPVHGGLDRRRAGANAALFSFHPAQHRGLPCQRRFVAGGGGAKLGLSWHPAISPRDAAVDAAGLHRRCAFDFHPRHRRSRHAADVELQKSSGAPGLFTHHHHRHGRCRRLCGLRGLGVAVAGGAVGGAKIFELGGIRQRAARRAGDARASRPEPGHRRCRHRDDSRRESAAPYRHRSPIVQQDLELHPAADDFYVEQLP